ncbi:hypothetical protein M2323_002268 [Rhodoblastus acidophilus]|uniref:hypothetical protein n=1 Tax=Rhodoblastus acidophilus TaxID=1074 RepID=UPI002224C939|nr:hypothetical protein [Rhodoblastus acidophilus]MCW2284490.1 hypothetical protein [Rhodoblastus acidophilus]MCW2333337.1 hypothetical protein [Rhodoblastus acidophilus]
MLFPSNWTSAQAASGMPAQPSIQTTNDRASSPAREDAELLDVATANYSGSAAPPPHRLDAALVAGFQAAAAEAGAPQNAAVSASAQLANLAMNIANAAANEISPYRVGAPQ